MDLLLYQLNISGLAITTVMIAVFFAVLRRSVRRTEMRWWLYGWTANIVAMAITSAFWYFQPRESLFGLVFALSLAAKMAYVWFLVRGALVFCGRRPRALTARVMVPFIAVVSVLAIFILDSRDRLGLATSVAIAVGMGAGTVSVWRTRAMATWWIVIAFASRVALAGSEAVAYAVNVVAEQGGAVESAFTVPASTVLAANYSLGVGAEWILAMGLVIAVSSRAQRELLNANEQMLNAQADLRRLADRDPLTALINRRVLPEVLRSVQPGGALLIFFDLNGFKQINDEHGHHVGDECLKRFATALTECFRPTDAVVRYGGDEFVVVAGGLHESALDDRLVSVWRRVQPSAEGELPIRFSVGVGRLPPGGNPDDALREADEAMYRAKPGRGGAMREAMGSR